MKSVTLSSKFQIVIPKEIREEMYLKPGQRMQAFCYGDRVELVPEKPIASMRGFLKGINTSFERAER